MIFKCFYKRLPDGITIPVFSNVKALKTEYDIWTNFTSSKGKDNTI